MLNSLAKLVMPLASLLSLSPLAPTSRTASPSPAMFLQTRHDKMVGSCLKWKGQITQLSAGSVTVMLQASDSSSTVSLTKTTIQAGLYPATAKILRPGEQVLLWKANQQAHLMVLPVARGQLHHTGQQWSIESPWRGTSFSLPTRGVDLVGMSQLKDGQRAMVFGTKNGTRLMPTLIAAPPAKFAATITAIQGSTVTLQTAYHGPFTYSLESWPLFPQPAHTLQTLKKAQEVTIFVNLMNRQVLALMPTPPGRDRRDILEHNAYGTVLKATPSFLRLQTAWGEQTVTLQGLTLRVIWPGHQGAFVTALPTGAPVWVHVDSPLKTVVIRVLPHSQP
ncbi:MAG: hypothetical protein OWR62_03265 [Sulfobacillus thermotolerans]|uniref:DUF5666 domain-containing protein n=1 Tax=Sulfobacillus thermotolerans TaxID=338644 RepID=A0ABM6RPI7_9FIRM|nr:hypothetical protein BXT84_04325 [Sulfobacillus thermotolerans]MCY0907390.1 hypothetical protein [Sulfobacillus thermotolerans]